MQEWGAAPVQLCWVSELAIGKHKRLVPPLMVSAQVDPRR